MSGYHYDEDGCTALIAAILNQAFSDALDRRDLKQMLDARCFINSKNQMFRTYCELLNLDPEFTEEKMNKQLKENKFKPLRIFRK